MLKNLKLSTKVFTLVIPLVAITFAVINGNNIHSHQSAKSLAR